jgi:hypothetical protein
MALVPVEGVGSKGYTLGLGKQLKAAGVAEQRPFSTEPEEELLFMRHEREKVHQQAELVARKQVSAFHKTTSTKPYRGGRIHELFELAARTNVPEEGSSATFGFHRPQ